MNRIEWTYYKSNYTDNNNQQLINKNLDEDDDEDDYIDEEKLDYNGPGIGKIKLPNELVSTPVGYMMAASGWNPLANRIMYIANTNFTLTEDSIKLLSIVPGIEHITVLSPYSFVVIVGIMFDDNEVIKDVEDTLDVVYVDVNDYIDENSPLAEILKPILKRVSESNYWMIYVFPNGKVLEKLYETKEDLQNDLLIYDEQKEGCNITDFSNGILLSNLNKQ
mgnify:CR=1 FL=1